MNKLLAIILCAVLSACDGTRKPSEITEPSIDENANARFAAEAAKQAELTERANKKAEEAEQKHQDIVDHPEKFDVLTKYEQEAFIEQRLGDLRRFDQANSDYKLTPAIHHEINFWFQKGKQVGISKVRMDRIGESPNSRRARNWAHPERNHP